MPTPNLAFFLRRALHAARCRLRAASIRAHLRRAGRSTVPLRIVVGSGGIGEPGWISTDIHSLNLLQPAAWQSVLQKNFVSAILAEHVWEHLTWEEGAAAAALCHEYLRPGGYLRLAVPDGNHPDPAYREKVRIGGTGPGAEDHKVLYTHETLGRLLAGAGFEVDFLEYFDAAQVFHARPWDPAGGLIRRSQRFDPRNRDGELHYTSLIVDARKR